MDKRNNELDLSHAYNQNMLTIRFGKSITVIQKAGKMDYLKAISIRILFFLR